MIIENNEKYNNLINQWSNMYIKAFDVDYTDQFDVHFLSVQNEQEVLNDIIDFAEDEQEKIDISIDGANIASCLFPYKNRTKFHIFITKKLYATELDDICTSRSFAHEYTHVVDFINFIQDKNWDINKRLCTFDKYNTLMYLSEFHSFYRGRLFANMFGNNTDLLTTIEILTDPKNVVKMLNFYEGVFIQNYQDDTNILSRNKHILEFLATHLLVNKYGTQEFVKAHPLPQIIVDCFGDKMEVIYSILNAVKNADSVISSVPTADTFFRMCNFI